MARPSSISRDTIVEKYKILQEEKEFPELKNEQLDVIENILNNRHAFGILPTGYGKSFCFGIPPLLMDKVNEINISNIPKSENFESFVNQICRLHYSLSMWKS